MTRLVDQRGDISERCRQADKSIPSLAYFCESMGMRVDTEGGVAFIHCPFHADTGRPSMAIYENAGKKISIPRGYCFTCKTLTYAVSLCKAYRNCSVVEALHELEQHLGTAPADNHARFSGAKTSGARTSLARDMVNSAQGHAHSSGLPSGTGSQVVRQHDIQRHNGTEQYHANSSSGILQEPRQLKNLRPALNECIKRLYNKDGIHARRYLERRGLLEAAHEYQFGLWFDDHSSWANRLVIPYLDSHELNSPVYALSGRSLGHDGLPAQDQVAQDDRRESGERKTGRRIPKYLYTVSQDREPYNWGIARQFVEQNAFLCATEGELDCLSILAVMGNDFPVIGLGGAGAVKSLGQDGSLAGVAVILFRDRDAKQANTDKAYSQAAQTLTQYNAQVHIVEAPEIDPGEKSDINLMLQTYGQDGLASWLVDSIAECVQDERILV